MRQNVSKSKRRRFGRFVPLRTLTSLKLEEQKADAARMQLIRLVYASVAQPSLDYAALTSIFRTAEARNDRDGITGILCFGNGYFLQALEGRRASVNATYMRIMADARHERCELLHYEAVDVRRYANWSMKLVGLDDQPTARRRDLVFRHSSVKQFEPLAMTGPQACHFLEELALLERTAA